MSPINLPPLDIARKNHASSLLSACNRAFAVYVVDAPDAPFWAVEIGPNFTPVEPARKYSNHSDAIACIAAWAQSFLTGQSLPIPETNPAAAPARRL